jgi:hypothetical protein
MKERSEIVILIAVSVISSLLLYLPFALNIDAVLGVKLPVTGIQVLERYYDGPLYVVVSKTFYTPASPLYSANFLPASYFAAHLPGYPIIIWLFSLALSPFIAMLVANLAISAAAVVVFYLLLTRFKLVHDPFSSALLFLFFPPRWFLYRSIGASEPLFILLTLLMLYFLKKDEATKATLLGFHDAHENMGNHHFPCFDWRVAVEQETDSTEVFVGPRYSSLVVTAILVLRVLPRQLLRLFCCEPSTYRHPLAGNSCTSCNGRKQQRVCG